MGLDDDALASLPLDQKIYSAEKFLNSEVGQVLKDDIQKIASGFMQGKLDELELSPMTAQIIEELSNELSSFISGLSPQDAGNRGGVFWPK